MKINEIHMIFNVFHVLQDTGISWDLLGPRGVSWGLPGVSAGPPWGLPGAPSGLPGGPLERIRVFSSETQFSVDHFHDFRFGMEDKNSPRAKVG